MHAHRKTRPRPKFLGLHALCPGRHLGRSGFIKLLESRSHGAFFAQTIESTELPSWENCEKLLNKITFAAKAWHGVQSVRTSSKQTEVPAMPPVGWF